MERNDPLLPFAYSTSSKNERFALNTDPREKYVRDQNASSMYHTRSTQKDEDQPGESPQLRGPVLLSVPSIKRKMGESFTEKDDVKRMDYDFFTGTPNDQVQTDSSNERQTIQLMEPLVSGGVEARAVAESSSILPSSPPVVNPVSEYDLSTHEVTVPDSPVLTPKAFNLETSPIKRLQVQSSEADFGIDQFNRFKFSSLAQSSSVHQSEELSNRNLGSSFNEARQIIQTSFENIHTSVSLAHMQLEDIPDEIKDLNNLVIFENSGHVMRQLYLNNNNLSMLNPNLFQFTKLNVLSLRQNKLIFIPSSIENLVDLRDLNLSINELRHLPPQILHLSKLHTFRAGPNPFVEVYDNATEIELSDLRYEKGLRWVSPIKIKRETSQVPTLKALCLNTIATYDVTYRETKHWKKSVPKLYHPIIALTISKGKFNERCNECDLIVVEPYATVYEWWNILLNKSIPIKRKFCSGKCVSKYNAV
ncbi:hypothetical protein PUMCH_000326 [Australozyma saopauloensis]|uniref:Uncharacterized protein n=1 Tax=Australozyma saopauloensis TaxID=291208 RepID=A0AAX4H3I6_9ASCO|nr:hypothetical protein PUMCH_000326 [[Candida] saopauloensis]